MQDISNWNNACNATIQNKSKYNQQTIEKTKTKAARHQTAM
jgi:hypothetical protein